MERGFNLFFWYRENHQITPAAPLVERQVVSDFYWLKTLYVTSVAQVAGVHGLSFEQTLRPQQKEEHPIQKNRSS